MARFELYRYQILPLDRFFHGDLFSDIQTIEELIGRKNSFFTEALRQIESLPTPKTETVVKRLMASDDFFLYRVAANRSIHRETRDFDDEYLDNWPSVLVAIWNSPEKQLIAVQKRTTAFQKTDSLVRAILSSVAAFLQNSQLRCLYEPLFEKQEFWKIINDNAGKVQGLEFEFITPNMANISQTLPQDLREFAKQTNSQRNKLSIVADSEAALKVDSNDPNVNGLVDYSAEGGGNISVKIAGMKRKYQTSRTVKEFEATDIELRGTAEEVAAVLKGLMEQ